MKKEVRLYNIILPIWLLWLFPRVWLVVLPGNLLVDCLVLTVTLAVLKHRSKGAVVRQLWWKLWLLGFLADFAGAAVLMSGLAAMVLAENCGLEWLREGLEPLWHNAFQSPLAFLWTLAAVALAGVCIYFLDRRAMKGCVLLSGREKHTVALAMAVVTAPWLFFIPVY